VNSAIGGSTNAQPHLAAMAKHAGVGLREEDWQVNGYDIPLLANIQPAGKWLGEKYHRAGGTPAIMWELLQAGKLDGSCRTVTGRTVAENLEGRESTDRDVILPYENPLKERAGFLV
ncbi:dihydroxy-acid dehydratase, partial [bacterium M00.F.Ca.ET.229.01.1.1]